MQNARMIGNCVEYLASKNGISHAQLCEKFGGDENSLIAFLKGRRLASFEQLSSIAELFKVPVMQLLEGDSKHYEESVVHCMNHFTDPKNREKILDLIDDYLDVLDAVTDVENEDGNDSKA